jgi:hypothetical protein
VGRKGSPTSPLEGEPGVTASTPAESAFLLPIKQGHPNINLHSNTPWAESKNSTTGKNERTRSPFRQQMTGEPTSLPCGTGKEGTKEDEMSFRATLTLPGTPFQFAFGDKPQKDNTLMATQSFTADGHTLKYGITVKDSPPIHREVEKLHLPSHRELADESRNESGPCIWSAKHQGSIL